VAESRAPGLRVQIVLALAGVLLLAFVPLFFAVANVTRATLQGSREQSARALGRAIAAHVGDVRATEDRAALRRVLESHVGEGGALAIGVFDAEGKLEASAGDAADVRALASPRPPYREATIEARGASGRVLDVLVPRDDLAVVARLRTDDDADRAAPLVRLVGLYMLTFGLALLVLTYFTLTRVIVRPLEALVHAADRVASGARQLSVPRAGAREIADLGTSVQEMTARLIANEQAMRQKVEEVTRATERLGAAQTQLVRSERLASVGRLAAGIAHEIGNPIAAIMGMEEILLEGDLPETEQRDFLQRMKRETERIHGILRDLLDFARPEAAPASAGHEPAVVAQAVDDVVTLLGPQRSFKGIAIEKDIETADRPLRVPVPAQRLMQILLNLLLNAGSAMTGAKKGSRVVVRARREGDRVRIEIEDDGPGVAPHVRDRLFEPFVTTKDVGDGTGLGLAVCRGIVESAGGEIGLDRTYTDGARFVIRLPAADPPASAPGA
jgi:signal transduction histidine kinase